MKKTRGFTLVELLITVAIVALLASVALPLAELAVQRSKEKELKQALRDLREAIDTYKKASDNGWIDKPANKSGYPPKLAALVDGVKDKRNPDPEAPKLYFLRRLPRDPMTAEGEWGLRSYKSSAAEPAAGDDVFDVYSMSAEKGMNGVPYREW
jgi:general secretion pathway protein G